MSTNISDFSPNATSLTCVRPVEADFEITSGDAMFELEIALCYDICNDEECGYGAKISYSSSFKKLDLGSYSAIKLYVVDAETKTLFGEATGTPVGNLKDGVVMVLFHAGFFDNAIAGLYLGEIEISYQNGRIITAVDRVTFNIVTDFSGHGA